MGPQRGGIRAANHTGRQPRHLSSSYGICLFLARTSKGCAETTLNLDGISSIPSACHRPVNSSALFPAQWEQPSTPCSLPGNTLSGHQGFLQSHHPLQLPLLAHKMAALSRGQVCPGTQEGTSSCRQGYCGNLCPGKVTNDTQPSQDTALQPWSIQGEGSPTASLQRIQEEVLVCREAESFKPCLEPGRK